MMEKVYPVTVSMTVQNMKEVRRALFERRNELYAALDGLNRELVSLDQALKAADTRYTLVASESQPDIRYRVERFGSKYTCTCPSFEWSSGLDKDGNCKHIRKAIQEGLG